MFHAMKGITVFPEICRCLRNQLCCNILRNSKIDGKPLRGRKVGLDHWENRWLNEEVPGFHRAYYSPNLVRFHSEVFKDGKRIFVPLCGKTLDLIFLADLGYEVVGLEFSKLGADGFFNDNKLTYTMAEVDGSPLIKYQTKDKNITFYCGDIFSLKPNVCGQFDGIWDRGSYCAINISERMTYIQLMWSLLKPGGRILLETYDYDPTKFAGPPHHSSEESLKSYFGEMFEIEFLYRDYDCTPPHYKPLDMGYMGRICKLNRK